MLHGLTNKLYNMTKLTPFIQILGKGLLRDYQLDNGGASSQLEKRKFYKDNFIKVKANFTS